MKQNDVKKNKTNAFFFLVNSLKFSTYDKLLDRWMLLLQCRNRKRNGEREKKNLLSIISKRINSTFLKKKKKLLKFN